MKTSLKGFVTPFLLIIVAILLVAGGGVYMVIQSISDPYRHGLGIPELPQATSSTQTSTLGNKLQFHAVQTTNPLEVQFLAVAPQKPSVDVELSYNVDFGDGAVGNVNLGRYEQTTNMFELSAKHIYQKPGTYTAKLIRSFVGQKMDLGEEVSSTMVTVPFQQISNSNPNMGGSLCPIGQVWSGPIKSGGCVSQNADWQAFFTSENLPPAPLGILLPQGCNVVSGNKAFDLAYKTFTGFEWKVNCGSAKNNDARATMELILKQQGWVFCDSGLANASWWRAGITTSISEGGKDYDGISYPFSLSQSQNASKCSN